jgi:hypothetical protein
MLQTLKESIKKLPKSTVGKILGCFHVDLPSISSTLNVRIFCTNVVFYVNETREKLPETTFGTKIRVINVDEIDT